ncbi:helix-turn-helix domain-containing protein [Paenibacillus sp. 19GGS1-52]|uniref:GH39 family glycosyl hydrolase n=1 Tax=Paenibacillus sp. 19GGS1-52 TaxID=2758563 RepID=UPI001EFB114D|nr:helix-turn-helix domain-containing protein [Paenibacillus sp. 19GGS1-52]ULO06550.1 helix-turn-helix domain-containing protein [Paenibacillus sp. 19GGS1-52]
MEFRHEVISFPKQLPIKFFLHRIGHVNRHWHQSLELIINIKGKVQITVNNLTHELEAGDIILINSNEVHELHADNTTMLALQIKLELLKEATMDIQKIYYDCNSAISGHPERFKNLKRIVAQILKYNINSNEYIDLKNISLVYELIYELCSNFSSDEKDVHNYSLENLDRLSRILDYINSKYSDPISLQNMAKAEYLSVPYLSKYFKRSMGMSFSDYLKDIRLHHAVNDLLNESLTIDKVAVQNGFPNVRSFVVAFTEKYGELPSVWRKKHASEILGSIEATKEKSVNYYQDEPLSYYEDISAFIESNLDSVPVDLPQRVGNSKTSLIEIQVSKSRMLLDHNFKNFIGVSRAKEVLLANVQMALRIAQEEIGFKYIKMHSLLDDDMMVYSEDAEGRAIYNFQFIDMVFDFILSIRLKPLVQFSFMPKLLASSLEKTVFYNQINTSPPKSIDKWNQLIRALTLHLIQRYGLEEVKTWLFCVWNEPSSSNLLFGFSHDDIFNNLYQNTYETVKQIDPSIPFGGPAAFSTYNKNEDWLFQFLTFSRDQGCTPDFITIHYYDIDLWDYNGQDTQLNLSPSTHSFTEFIDRLKQRLQESEFDSLPVYLTEWNSTVSHKDLMSDTCFKSAYIIKNLTENYDRLDAFGYWLLTDLHEENLLPQQLFHGGLGLFTYNNIKKPSYHAFSFLNKLGDELIASGDGYFVTKSRTGFQILLHNYHHYDEVYAKGISISISYHERYSHFPVKLRKEFNIELSPVNGKYDLVQHIVNQQFGSAFDNENQFVAENGHSIEEINYLRSISVPKLSKKCVQASGKLPIQVILEPFEIRLIELTERFENNY